MKNMKVETTGQVRLWDVASGSPVGNSKVMAKAFRKLLLVGMAGY